MKTLTGFEENSLNRTDKLIHYREVGSLYWNIRWTNNILSFAKFFIYYVFSLVGERIFPTGYCPIDRESEGLRFNVVIREDAKVSPFTDVIVKAALSTHLF